MICEGGHDHFKSISSGSPARDSPAEHEEHSEIGEEDSLSEDEERGEGDKEDLCTKNEKHAPPPACHCQCTERNSNRILPKSLLLTCRKLYASTERLLYTNNRFVFTTIERNNAVPEAVLRFCKSLSTSQFSILRKLHFQAILIPNRSVKKIAKMKTLLCELWVQREWKSLFDYHL